MGMADRIKERRLFCGFTQEELAERLGLQKSAIAKYENGRVENIKRSIIEKMAMVLECSPSYLMGWDAEETEPEEEPAHVNTLAAHFDGEDFSEDEMKEIMQFAEFVKSRRK